MRNWCRVTMGCFLLCAVVLVVPHASVAGNVIHVPGDYPTIQAGVYASVSGDTVLVASGTYTGPGNRDIKFGNRTIVLMSVGGPSLTTIDCQGLARGFTLHGHVNEHAVVDGFTVTHGNSTLGGGISVRGNSSPTIRNCVFIDNAASEFGGGIYVGDQSFPTFEHCTIQQNHAPIGGGIGVGNNPVFVDLVEGQPDVECTFANCTISGNEAELGGGVFVNQDASPTFSQCTITGNLADNGGGLMVREGGFATINGSTIAANRALVNGGGMHVACTALATQTIVWSNCAADSGDQVYTTPAGSVSFACSDVDDSGVEGEGTVLYDLNTIHLDPLFCSEYLCTSAPTTAGVYTLDDDSQALAAHSPCGELIGSQPQGCTSRTFEVVDGGQYLKIQDAIDRTVTGVGDVVLVDDNTWSGPRNTELDFGGKKIVLKSKGGAAQAIIDGGNTVRGIVFQNGEGSESQVEGFTFTRGAAGVPGSAVLVTGGSSPVIKNCVIKQNHGNSSAVRVEDGDPAFKNCTIEENTITTSDGVLEFVGGNPKLEECIVRNNAASTAVMVATPMIISTTQVTGNGGCGVYLAPTASLPTAVTAGSGLPEQEMSWSVIENSDISRNADRGVVIDGSTAVFEGVLFRENGEGGVIVTGLGPGALAARSSRGHGSTAAATTTNQFNNCEFSGHSTDRGAGFYFDCTNEPEGAYVVTFNNCRITGNHATFEGGGVAICGRATNADITPVFNNCTIAANSALDGGGVYMGVTEIGAGRLARADFSRTILWGNCSTASPLGEAYVLPNNQMEIGCSHSDVSEITGGGVINATQTTTGIPDFCDYPSSYYSLSCEVDATIEGDFFLAPNSPAAPVNHPCGPSQIGAFPVGNCSPTSINDQPVRNLPTSIGAPVPNPFNPVTSVEFTLETGLYVSLRIYDVNGRLARTLVDRPMAQGPHRIEWDGRDDRDNPAASGVYFLRFEAGRTKQTHKMVLLK